MPSALPVTTPDVGSMLAIEASLLLQVPNNVVLVRVMLVPVHWLVAPAIGDNVVVGLTVISAVARSLQP
jgi:hypothetical protein